jgi:hypothetical protein
VARTGFGATCTASSTFAFTAQTLLDEGGGRHDSANTNPGQYMRVDLGRGYWIDSAEMDQNSTPYAAAGMFVYTSLDASTWTMVWNGGPAVSARFDFRPTFARYVHFEIASIPTGNNWVKHAIRVFACKPYKLQNKNLSGLGLYPYYGTLSQTSGGANNSGDRQNPATGGRWDFSNGNSGNVIQLDLGASRQIIRAYFTSENTTYGPASVRLDASNDGSNWTAINSYTNNGSNVWSLSRQLPKYRYWRIVSLVNTGGNQNWVWYVFSLFGDALPIIQS